MLKKQTSKKLAHLLTPAIQQALLNSDKRISPEKLALKKALLYATCKKAQEYPQKPYRRSFYARFQFVRKIFLFLYLGFSKDKL